MTSKEVLPVESTKEAAFKSHCRSCQAPLESTFVDLGMSPLCESYVPASRLNSMEPFYPLRVLVCDKCKLVQLLEYVSPADIFSEYAYFSSYSDSWLKHARDYVEMIVARLKLQPTDQVIEVASNDGYLLQYFVAKGFLPLGIEPAANVAAEAKKKGVTSRVAFFGVKTAREVVAEGKQAKLLLGNNVLAHVPDLNDFVGGLKVLLAPGGTITLEFPHLQRLIEGNQFDTIYHEHFSYFSFLSVERVLNQHGLKIYDVQELASHGGSLRLFSSHKENSIAEGERVTELRRREVELGYDGSEIYASFDARTRKVKNDLLEFLIRVRREGKSVAGYGAPGKGNTLLNYCGIRSDYLDYTVDRNPYKHGQFLPGTHIPICPPERLKETRPDYILILPWNLKKEIATQLDFIRGWGGKLVVAIPELEVF
jgi:hypothetical protein